MNKKTSKRILWWSLGLSFLPIASLLLAFIFSNLLDCDLAVAGEYSCKVGGPFVGEALYTMFTFGWFAFFSVPAGLLVALTAGVVYLLSVKK